MADEPQVTEAETEEGDAPPTEMPTLGAKPGARGP